MEPLSLASVRIRRQSAAAPDPRAEHKPRLKARRGAGGKVRMEAAPAAARRKAESSARWENPEQGHRGPSSDRCKRQPSLKYRDRYRREIRSWSGNEQRITRITRMKKSE